MKKIICIALTALLMALKANAQESVLKIPYGKGEGKSIYGIISKPTTGKKHGIAIVSHGFNGSHHFGRDYFKTLNDLGYAVYTFDFPNGSVNSLSGNNTLEMSVSNEKEALKAIIRHFRSCQDIDKKRIVLIGESQGGLVSALAAAERKRQISSLILIYPALCIPDNWNQRYPTPNDIPDVSEIWGVKLGKAFMLDLRHMDVYHTIGKYRGPVLIIHGTDDPVVPIDYSKRAALTYRNAQLRIINKAGHGFNPQQRIMQTNMFASSYQTNKHMAATTHNGAVAALLFSAHMRPWRHTSRFRRLIICVCGKNVVILRLEKRGKTP